MFYQLIFTNFLFKYLVLLLPCILLKRTILFMSIKNTLLFILFACLLSACEKESTFTGFNGTGKKPIYISLSELGDIKNLPPQTIEQTGTIFLRDTLFFMLEFKKGIHVFNILDTMNTAALTFWNIPAITDFTISGNRVYADSWRDLVTIDVSDLYQIQEVGRNKDTFKPVLYPPLYDGYFECVDENKGVLIGWEDALLENARCNTN
jgi:hypothetical protein